MPIECFSKYPFSVTISKKALFNFLVRIFTFIVIIDPPGSFLHLKDPLFLLLLCCCIFTYKPDTKLLIPFIVSLIIWTVSTCIGYTTLQIEDPTFNTGILKALLPLILLGWIKYLNFLNKLLAPCIVISIISITVMVAMCFDPLLEKVLYTFFTDENGLMMISRREFLGISISSAFYRSTPVLIFPLARVTQQLIEKKSKKNILLFIIFFFGLFSGGNRACILSALGIPICIYLFNLYSKRKYNQLLSFLLIFSSFAIYVIYELLSESHEVSNVAKFGHLESYIIFFNDNYWTLLFGQGPGGLMFSLGFNSYTVQTEWSYIELFRYFGIFGALIIFLIYFFPLLVSIKHYKSFNSPSFFIVGCIFYLIAAGTNPLLLSSTGMIICFYCYSYIYHKQCAIQK